MAGTSDDDVPKRATATGYGRGDGNARLPATQLSPTVDDDEERTATQAVDSTLRGVAEDAAASLSAPMPFRPSPSAPPPRTRPRWPTVVGLAPPPPTRADPRPGDAIPSSEIPSMVDSDGEDAAITALAPAASSSATSSGPSLPLTVPSNVEIREIQDDDALEETEVRTVVNGTVPGGLPDDERPSGVAASGRSDAVPSTLSDGASLPRVYDDAEVEPGDDSVTKLASKRLPPSSEPAVSMPVDTQPETKVEDSDPYSGDGSVTRGLPRGLAGQVDQVAPRTLEAAGVARDRAGMDDDEAETAQAPSHLTNMLRVIATPEDGAAQVPDTTAVMPNAPVKPVGHESRRASESGLQMVAPEASGGDRASVGALLAGTPAASAPASMDHPFVDHGARPSFASADGIHALPYQPIDASTIKKPRYGLLVGVVATLSLAIPVALFLLLQRPSQQQPVPRVASEVVPDTIGRGDEVRVKAVKPPPPPVASSSKPSRPVRRPPKKVRGGSRPRKR